MLSNTLCLLEADFFEANQKEHESRIMEQNFFVPLLREGCDFNKASRSFFHQALLYFNERLALLDADKSFLAIEQASREFLLGRSIEERRRINKFLRSNSMLQWQRFLCDLVFDGDEFNFFVQEMISVVNLFYRNWALEKVFILIRRLDIIIKIAQRVCGLLLEEDEGYDSSCEVLSSVEDNYDHDCLIAPIQYCLLSQAQVEIATFTIAPFCIKKATSLNALERREYIGMVLLNIIGYVGDDVLGELHSRVFVREHEDAIIRISNLTSWIEIGLFSAVKLILISLIEDAANNECYFRYLSEIFHMVSKERLQEKLNQLLYTFNLYYDQLERFLSENIHISFSLAEELSEQEYQIGLDVLNKIIISGLLDTDNFSIGRVFWITYRQETVKAIDVTNRLLEERMMCVKRNEYLVTMLNNIINRKRIGNDYPKKRVRSYLIIGCCIITGLLCLLITGLMLATMILSHGAILPVMPAFFAGIKVMLASISSNVIVESCVAILPIVTWGCAVMWKERKVIKHKIINFFTAIYKIMKKAVYRDKEANCSTRKRTVSNDYCDAGLRIREIPAKISDDIISEPNLLSEQQAKYDSSDATQVSQQYDESVDDRYRRSFTR